MNNIFGYSMNSIMVVLLVMLGFCLLVVAWIAIRRPVVFKLGVRNIPRRVTQTVLIVIGLMLSTLIIAAALGTGDTIDYSATSATYSSLGQVDEMVLFSKTEDGKANINNTTDATIPQSLVQDIENAFQGTDLIDAVMPVLIKAVPAVLLVDGQPTQSEPNVNLVGIESGRVAQFGGLKDVDGKAIDFTALPADGVVISKDLRKKLDAKVGGTIFIYYDNKPVSLTVSAIAEDSPLSGKFDPVTPGMAIPLDRLQTLSREQGLLTLVAVSNKGGVRDGLKLTDQVSAKLLATLKGQPYGVDKIKQKSIDLSVQFANVFTTLFLVFGLFSISVGILLIILIFSMLAAERRSEMGMTRAIGGQRLQLVQQFISEGTAYALLAGLVGSLLGAAATVAIGLAVQPLLGDFLTVTPHVTLRSMIVAYCLGVVITFIAVVVSSWRISRLNIVAAVRDIPDVSNPKRRLRTIVWGVVLLLIGIAGILSGLSSKQAFTFYSGMSLAPFGIAMILRYFGVPARPVFTLIGIYIVTLWLLPDSVTKKIFGDISGGIEMFFLSGIFMVAGATILIVQNLDILLAGLTRVGGLFKAQLPAVKIAVAFPGAAKGRTGLTIAMFSLIVFSLVMFSTINRNFTNLFTSDEAGAGWDVRADNGSANPVGDTGQFQRLLKSKGVDVSDVKAAGQTTANFQINMRRAADKPWRTYALKGMDASFIDQSEIKFQQRATGYADDKAILSALKMEPDAVVIDALALAGQGGFGSDASQFTMDDPDGPGPQQALTSKLKVFDPIPVQLEALDGSVKTVRVIGVVDTKISTLFGMFGAQALTDSVNPTPTITSYFLRLSDPGASDKKAKAIETALITNGVQGNSIREELKKQQSQSTGFLYILQGFMGLGLIVGIAAVGVIAFRSVVERRQQIGVLRALGFQQSMVSLSFLIETAFIVGLGVISGTVLGLALARNLFASPDFAGTSGVAFTIPWSIVIAIVVITIVAALLMALVPARQASRLAPAEALRYE